MCDFIVISTDSPKDLTKITHDTAEFSTDIGFEKPLELLKHPHQYRLYESKNPCGCFFRTVDPNFGMIEPQDWLEEDDEVLHNTYFAYDTIKSLLIEGYQVDCVSIWTSQTPDDSVHDYRKINLNEISHDAFAFLFQSYLEYELS